MRFKMGQINLLQILKFAGAAVFILALVHSFGGKGRVSEPMKGHRLSFDQIAWKYKADKVTIHMYQNMYNKYFEPIRDQHLKLLEIGLGCDMPLGPGASYYTWLEYFPHVDLYFIEYDAECAAKWSNSTTGAKIFTGDQADVGFLQQFIIESGGDFDIIIDDGGHTMLQQQTSFDTLFPALKPGGMYVCEDLYTSYMPEYGGGTGGPDTMMGRIKVMMDGLMVDFIKPDIYSIDCMRKICAFFKKHKNVTY